MLFLKDIRLANILVIIGVAFIFLLKYIWNRRWLYYYASKLEGPVSLPLIGFSHHILFIYDDFLDFLKKMTETYPSIFKFWIGRDLFIVNSRPQDVEIVFNKFLEKTSLYKIVEIVMQEGLVTEDVEKWKKHRKVISRSFKSKVLHTFIGIFSSHTKKLLEEMAECCEENQIDIFQKFWRYTLDTACETMLDLNPELVNGQEKFISMSISAEDNGSKKWLFVLPTIPKIFWKFWKIHLFFYRTISWASTFSKKLIELKQKELLTSQNFNDPVKSKKFLNNLVDVMKTDNFLSEQELHGEVHTMLLAASETIALTLSSLMIALALHKDVQKKIYKELESIFEGTQRDVTLENLNKMDYTERVIKKTMRLLPPTPVISRHINEDIEINSVVYPKGCNIIIPIITVHRNPAVWDDPLVFNPDRFLPENSKNRPQCAYIPFSYGPRSCIGFQYGMIYLKLQLAMILRRYEIISVNHKSLDDIKFVYSVLAKPKDGCKILLKQRGK